MPPLVRWLLVVCVMTQPAHTFAAAPPAEKSIAPIQLLEDRALMPIAAGFHGFSFARAPLLVYRLLALAYYAVDATPGALAQLPQST